jgi:hypothetical protein
MNPSVGRGGSRRRAISVEEAVTPQEIVIPNKSLPVARVVYDAATSRLFVRFRNHPERHNDYCYYSVDSNVFRELTVGPSITAILDQLPTTHQYDKINNFPVSRKQSGASDDRKVSSSSRTHSPSDDRKVSSSSRATTTTVAATSDRADSRPNAQNNNQKKNKSKSKKGNNQQQRNIITPQSNEIDFSFEWTEAIKAACKRKDMKYLKLLHDVLSNLSQKRKRKPPTILPPAVAAEETAENVFMSFVPPVENNESYANIYDALAEFGSDDDSDTASSLDDNDYVAQAASTVRSARTMGSSFPKQCRYIHVNVLCTTAEVYRLISLELERKSDRDISEAVTKWELCYKLLNETFVSLDGWYAILIDAEMREKNQRKNLREAHNYDQLNTLFENLNLTRDHIEREKDKVLNRFETQLEVVNRKLNPLLRDRDAIKSKIGEEKWKNNPNPKMDFVARRAELEMAKRSLEQAIERLSTLELYEWNEEV